MSDYDIEWFVERMEQKLKENRHKRGWDDIDLDYALMRMREEVEEITPLVDEWDHWPEQATEIIRECADVANFAFMLAHKIRTWEV